VETARKENGDMPAKKKQRRQECLICFEATEDARGCADPRCTGVTCPECTTALVAFSARERSLPKCPVAGCNCPYTLSALVGAEDETLATYADACLAHFTKERGDDVRKDMDAEEIVRRLREERIRFVQTAFPPSIALVARVALRSKMRAIDARNRKKTKQALEAARRPCMRATCTGFLERGDDVLRCLRCESAFCARCERDLKDGGGEHTCAQNDLDSMELVNAMVKCPGCRLPVFKNQGCDSITCANCGANFSYTTGERGGHGSSNARLALIEHRRRLSEVHAARVPGSCLDALLAFESVRPCDAHKESVAKPLIALFRGKTQPEVASWAIARRLYTYYRSHFRVLAYERATAETERLLLAEERDEAQIRAHLEAAHREIVTEEHVAVPRKPPAVKRKPPAVKRKPPAVKRKPPAVKRKPPAVKRKPPAVKRKPPPVKRKPPPVKRKPPLVKAEGKGKGAA
jgi:hypothetical protein